MNEELKHAQARAEDLVKDAQVLAKLANLNLMDRAGVDYFQHNFKDFVPERFWEPWRFSTKEELQKAWQEFPNISSEELRAKLRPGPPPVQKFQEWLQDAWRTGFSLNACLRLLSACSVFSELSLKLGGDVQFEDFVGQSEWPAQRAILFLAVDVWRARFCQRCGKMFVADKTGRKFCSSECFATSRKNVKRLWASDAREKQRSKKQSRRKR